MLFFYREFERKPVHVNKEFKAIHQEIRNTFRAVFATFPMTFASQVLCTSPIVAMTEETLTLSVEKDLEDYLLPEVRALLNQKASEVLQRKVVVDYQIEDK